MWLQVVFLRLSRNKVTTSIFSTCLNSYRSIGFKRKFEKSLKQVKLSQVLCDCAVIHKKNILLPRIYVFIV